jgi:hypothetical protein
MSPRVEASVRSDCQQIIQYRSDEEMNTTAYAMMEVKGTKRSDNNTTARRTVVMKSQRVGCLFSARDERRDAKSYRSKAGKSSQMHRSQGRAETADVGPLRFDDWFPYFVRQRLYKGKLQREKTHTDDRTWILTTGMDCRTSTNVGLPKSQRFLLQTPAFGLYQFLQHYQSNKRLGIQVCQKPRKQWVSSRLYVALIMTCHYA